MTPTAMDCTTTNLRLEAALDYAERGWKVIPLADKNKNPRINDWQHKASSEEDQILEWWEQWPGSNVGVKLGPDSCLIDVECDGPDAEKDLLAIFGDTIPICPTYQAHRGKHRLFKWRGDLPGGACFHIGQVGDPHGQRRQGSTVGIPSLRASKRGGLRVAAGAVS